MNKPPIAESAKPEKGAIEEFIGRVVGEFIEEKDENAEGIIRDPIAPAPGANGDAAKDLRIPRIQPKDQSS